VKKLNYILIILLFSLSFLNAQNPGMVGTDGLYHTQTGRTLQKGYLAINSNMNFYTKLGEFIGDASLRPDDFSAANYWLVAGNLGFRNDKENNNIIKI